MEKSTTTNDYIKSLPLYVLPHHAISRIIFWLTRIESPYAAYVIRWFIRTFNVDMSEAIESDSNKFKSFNHFFTRAIKPELRPLCDDNSALCCPVDGAVSQKGPIEDGRVFQAKGQDYSLLELLGGNEEWTARLENGHFTTIYLSPRDYHRIHMPCAGELKQMTHAPGRLFSVAPHTARVVPRLFSRNERVITFYETEFGPMALVLVGAINVAAIETTWAGLVTPPMGMGMRHWHYEKQAVTFNKGEEMGRFNMGSTVVAVFGFDVDWQPSFEAEAPTRMGATMAATDITTEQEDQIDSARTL